MDVTERKRLNNHIDGQVEILYAVTREPLPRTLNFWQHTLLRRSSGCTIFLKETQLAAQKFGIELDASYAHRPDDIEKAFTAAAFQHADAVIVFDDPVLWSYRKQIVSLAAAQRLPAMYGYSDFVDDGGLISYGPDRPDQYRRTAIYVDKILRGAQPAELPVEQPVKFELIVNRKTATALGLRLPAPIEVSADKVID